MFDESFFVAVAFFIVVGYFVYLGLPRKLGVFLDTRAAEIAAEIESAKKLRAEADKLLADYERQRAEAEATAAEIVKQAEANAAKMAAEGKAAMEAQLARRTAQAEEKISRAEAQMVQEVRQAIIAAAVTATGDVLRDKLPADQAGRIVDDVIGDLSGKLH